jgi:hypothetical protein
LPEPGTREPSIGELLAVLLGDTPGLPQVPADGPAPPRPSAWPGPGSHAR